MSRTRRRWTDWALPCAAVLGLAVAANLATLRFPLRWDLTAAGVYSIGSETREVLESLTEPVDVVFFYDVRDRSMQDARRLLDQYAAATPLFRLRAADPVHEPGLARRHGVAYAGTAVFESGGRRLQVNGGSEIEFTNTLIRVTRSASRTLCFLEGHGEADPFSLESQDHAEGLVGPGLGGQDNGFGRALVIHEREGMGMARASLETLGYGVRTLSLVQLGEVPADCHVVLLAGPRRRLLPREVEALGRWLDRAGKLAVFLDQGDAGLGRLLARYGVRVDAGQVVDPESHYGTDASTPAVSRYERHKLTRKLPLTFFPGAASLSMTAGAEGAVRYVPFLQTSRFARTGDGAPGLRTLGVLASRSREAPAEKGAARKSELIVVGDSDFARNSHFAILGNGTLLLNIVNYLAEQEDLSGIRPRNYELPQVTLTNGQMGFTFLLSGVLLPLLGLAGALRAWVRRR